MICDCPLGGVILHVCLRGGCILAYGVQGGSFIIYVISINWNSPLHAHNLLKCIQRGINPHIAGK